MNESKIADLIDCMNREIEWAEKMRLDNLSQPESEYWSAYKAGVAKSLDIIRHECGISKFADNPADKANC